MAEVVGQDKEISNLYFRCGGGSSLSNLKHWWVGDWAGGVLIK